MPVTLAQAALNATDDIDVQIINEFRKSSDLLNRLTFDDVVSGAGNGATLTYGYTRQITQRGAAFRAINSEYVPTEVTKARYSVDLKPLGGSFQIDRVLSNVARGQEVAFQLRELIQGTRSTFADQVINGDSNWDANGFDGLDKILRGTATEYLPGANGVSAGYLDWTAIDSKAEALAAIATIDDWLASLDGTPDVIYGNRKTISLFKMVAAWGDFLEGNVDAFDRQITTYQGIPLVDLLTKGGSNTNVIQVESRDLDNSVVTATVNGTPTGGTYTLTVTANGTSATTAAIAYNAAASAVQTALRALSNVGSDGATVSGSGGGPYTITFSGQLAGEYVTVALGTNSLTGGSSPTVAITAGAGNAAISGLSDLYAVRFGLDGFHGVSMAGQPLMRQWLPDFSTAGAVKTGEVEMGPVAVVLKRTKAAGVLRHIKVAS
jgi:hypothetical protein